MIKGQEKLFNEIDMFTEDNLPHSILLIGEEGSGKHSVCEYISDRFNLDLFDVSEGLSDSFIDEINQSQTKSLYLINIDKISPSKQNVILKLFEEPSQYAYIIIISSIKERVLDTILSRSYLLQMSLFSRDFLREYVTNSEVDYILDVCSTPGQVQVANRTDMNKLRDVCVNLLDRIQDAPLFNVLSILNKINFSDEYNKFDLLLFIRVLNHECVRRSNILDLYLIFKHMGVYINLMNNKKSYFERCLIEAYEHRTIKK